jgi:hypothetical protein
MDSVPGPLSNFLQSYCADNCNELGTNASGATCLLECKRSGEIAMPTPKEYRERADECLELMTEPNEWYVKTALLELALEFQKRAQKLDRSAATRGSP